MWDRKILQCFKGIFTRNAAEDTEDQITNENFSSKHYICAVSEAKENSTRYLAISHSCKVLVYALRICRRPSWKNIKEEKIYATGSLNWRWYLSDDMHITRWRGRLTVILQSKCLLEIFSKT